MGGPRVLCGHLLRWWWRSVPPGFQRRAVRPRGLFCGQWQRRHVADGGSIAVNPASRRGRWGICTWRGYGRGRGNNVRGVGVGGVVGGERRWEPRTCIVRVHIGGYGAGLYGRPSRAPCGWDQRPEELEHLMPASGSRVAGHGGCITFELSYPLFCTVHFPLPLDSSQSPPAAGGHMRPAGAPDPSPASSVTSFLSRVPTLYIHTAVSHPAVRRRASHDRGMWWQRFVHRPPSAAAAAAKRSPTPRANARCMARTHGPPTSVGTHKPRE